MAKVGRPRSCHCGECKKCKRAEYMREWWAKLTPEEKRAKIAQRNPERVAAEYKCWGEIIVHDVGVRAEFAEILCLFHSTTQAAWLQRAAERYGVPLVDSQEEAEALAAPQGIRVPVEMRPDRPEADLEESLKKAMRKAYSYFPAKSHRHSFLWEP